LSGVDIIKSKLLARLDELGRGNINVIKYDAEDFRDQIMIAGDLYSFIIPITLPVCPYLGVNVLLACLRKES
jgi:hypothetical protein